MAILFGGHETTSKSFCTALLKVKQHPEIGQKLKKELDEILLENGKYSVKDLDKIITMENLDKLDYLTCFIKECLRHDPPAGRSLGYKAKAAFKVKEILIPKNQIIVFNIFAAHYNEKQWINPMEFIPERFDSTSEYYLTPDGKQRHPLSYCPFTFGTRTCPGKALGLMEFKILVIYFMLAIDYEIESKIVDDPDVIFAIMSDFTLDIKVTKIHA